MLQIQTQITSQGLVSVPTAVRNFLGLTPGSVLVWKEDSGRISVERSVRHSTTDVHQALFGDDAALPMPAKTIDELKQGIRQHMKRRHAGG